ncbi:hypothetical protein BRD17_00805 [Halobacteriales archaeon SW_7_68_16]|nr:MAG: hypothetical protein BRD17_00805 [Halobacteriales archaeon SW_7_68_16]
MSVTRQARTRLVSRWSDLIDGIDAAADAVVDDWSEPTEDGRGRPATDDPTAIVEPLERRLDDAGVTDDLPAALADAVDAAGYGLSATPVPAPPYVTVTSRGPVLRATLEDDRLVVTCHVFEVIREKITAADAAGSTVLYARIPDPLRETMTVDLR